MSKSITVVSATSTDVDSHAMAIEKTAAAIPFPCKMLLLAPTKPTEFSGEWRQIKEWMPNGKWDIPDLNRFLISALHKHIETDFAVVVQWDGYAINPEAWTDEFLSYDYIGAPWPKHFDNDHGGRVGNGGFSLRSKRWLEIASKLPLPNKTHEPEDKYQCDGNLSHFQNSGCQIAPIGLAIRWSFENIIEEYQDWKIADSFGFHGVVNLRRLCKMQLKNRSQPMIQHKHPVRFFHTGDLGDIIASLPIIRELGGGKLVLGTAKNTPEHVWAPRSPMTLSKFNWMKRLLGTVPYIQHLHFGAADFGITHDLSNFRVKSKFFAEPHKSLIEHQAEFLEVPNVDLSPWISVNPSARTRGKAVISRSPRYHNKSFPWKSFLDQHPKRVFIGHHSEFTSFRREHRVPLEYIGVQDALELAELIAGSDIFIGNQSFPCWLAMAMGHNLVQETWPHGANSIVERPNARFIGFSQASEFQVLEEPTTVLDPELVRQMNAPRMKGKICVTTTFDRAYMPAGKTLIKSIKHHTNCAGIDFKVITADPEVVKEFGAENCHFVNREIQARYANVKYSKDLPQKRYAASWHRFEMFSLEAYDRVICIDSDCLCLEDMSYLFSEELNQYDLISVEDHVVSKGFSTCLSQLETIGNDLTGLRRRLSEGNIDVQPALLVANKRIVNKEWYSRLLHYANTTGFTYSIDEGILNDFIYLEKLRIKLLPLEYDYQDLYELHYPSLPVPARPIIVHCEVAKPFKKSKHSLDRRLRKWYDKWWEEARFGPPKQPAPNSMISPAPAIQASAETLDSLAIKHKCDKSSLYHNFAVKYEKLFSAQRHSFTNILEIGVALGQSVRMWVDYFPNATVHGADIWHGSKGCASYSKRIKIHMLDQSKEDELKRMGQFAPFDLIIDDGNHFWREQIVSFKSLFSFLKSGGMYVVEDSCTSYWTEYKNNDISCVDFFKGLVDEVNLYGAKGRLPVNPSPDFPSWEKGFHRREDCQDKLPEFESIHFMNGIIVIHKR